jgi:putative acetyltransferase
VIKIRLFDVQDAEQIAQLFHDTVRQVNLGDYSSRQVRAWAPDDLQFRDWATACARRFTYVAVNETFNETVDDEVNGVDCQNLIVGFGELEPNGHIDCFYCHRNYQRCGVGRQIYHAIEAKAKQLCLHRLFTEASITAKPFFERMGFSVIGPQQVICRGEVFVNYAMEKRLEH